MYLCNAIERDCPLMLNISRDGAVVARWAHNPKVVRSSRAPATKMNDK